MTHDLHDDDAPVGRVLSRREALRLLGGAGATGFLFLAGCGAASDATGVDTPDGTASCVATPELTEGPYFVDEHLNRSDIRSDASSGIVKDGALLALTFNVSRVTSNACTPLANAQVDVWHCDALGVYSDVSDPGFNTRGQSWLRGYQVTDTNGAASFTTVFPGWYQGRATHVHFKVRGTVSGSSFEFTSQLFFTESVLTSLYTSVAPYTTKGDSGRLRNASDGIYNQGSTSLLVTPASSNGSYAATLNVGLNV